MAELQHGNAKVGISAENKRRISLSSAEDKAGKVPCNRSSTSSVCKFSLSAFPDLLPAALLNQTACWFLADQLQQGSARSSFRFEERKLSEKLASENGVRNVGRNETEPLENKSTSVHALPWTEKYCTCICWTVYFCRGERAPGAFWQSVRARKSKWIRLLHVDKAFRVLCQTDLSGSGISLITLQQLPAIAVSQEESSKCIEAYVCDYIDDIDYMDLDYLQIIKSNNGE
ncbi:hypothetical protein Anapl_15210 [Anas platyrhynchos]|uniref:Uncharacterized protein n=1 Tax=Anas platyrhynchos TaxID=8839 RepID=R0KXH8_ANAPL|nr:hypothetical protein Anapl_15210 [Anas platyrhynchos]